MRLLPLMLCACLLALPSCHKADPIEDQISILKADRSTSEKKRACENLRKIAKKQAVPGLVDALKVVNATIKGEIAQILGDLKDPSAAAALGQALDLSVADDGDADAHAQANGANKLIARALGDIGGKDAVQPLIGLLEATHDDYVRIETLTALGKLKDPAAVPALSKIALDEHQTALITKKALLSLAKIDDPAALPTFMTIAFERKSDTFFSEAAVGLFMLGDAAKDPILALLKNEKDLPEWAEARDILISALYAKLAQIQADLQDKRAVEPLIKLLRHEDENESLQRVVRMNAAFSLGRMRAEAAAGPIAAMLADEDATTRGVNARALVEIGDKAALPKLAECARSGSWGAREPCMLGLALLGGQGEIKILDGFAKDEAARYAKECAKAEPTEPDCKVDVKERPAYLEGRVGTIDSYKKALELITACKDDKCLEAALAAAEPVVRERAAYELGRHGAAGAVPALLAAVKRPIGNPMDLKPRVAAICAVDWITGASPAAMAAAKGEAAALHAQIEQEKDNPLATKVADEAQRLAIKLERAK